jgi:tetratricopeptide (TPR) repeat protein
MNVPITLTIRLALVEIQRLGNVPRPRPALADYLLFFKGIYMSPVLIEKLRKIVTVGALAATIVTTQLIDGKVALAQNAPPSESSGPAGPPSRVLERAIKLYESKDYPSATIELKKVLAGESGDDPKNQQRAEFFMGKSFYKLKFYAAALSYFEKIVKVGPSHAYHAAALKWLAGLSRVLPETSGILKLIGSYDASALEEPLLKDVKEELYYLLGRHFYSRGGEGDFDKALELFGRVSKENEFYIKAKFFSGVTYVRQYKGQPAIEAFKDILIIGEEKPKQYRPEEITEYVDLARLQMARVFYSTQQFDKSIKYYEKLEQSSRDWTKSLFEASWAYYMKTINSKALGNIHTLNAPYFEDEFFPESVLLRSVIFYRYCQYDRARESIAEYNTKYKPLAANLNAILEKTQDNAEFYEYIQKVIAKKAGLDDVTQRLVLSVLADKTLKKTFAWVDQLDKELVNLGKSDKAWQTTQVAGEVLRELTLQQSEAQTNAGKVARDRIQRLQSELGALSRDGTKIEFQILDGQADKLAEDSVTGAIKKGSKEEPILVDDEHFEWRFNGEYWKDELGYYRFKIRSECKK